MISLCSGRFIETCPVGKKHIYGSLRQEFNYVLLLIRFPKEKVSRRLDR